MPSSLRSAARAAGWVGCALLIAGCGASTGLPPGGYATTGSIAPAPLSVGRLNAARAILHDPLDPQNTIRFDLLQYDPADPLQNRCDPLGNINANPWTSRLGGFKDLIPALSTSEYDVLFTSASLETDVIVGLRLLPGDSSFFSAVEVNFRAVNPFAAGHTPGGHYFVNHAGFPSNDDNPLNRSVIDFEGGDAAILVRGVRFAGAPVNARASINFLGPLAWVHFMRDNAFGSGRFYAVLGAIGGGPPALSDDGNPFNDGFALSLQVNGDTIDPLSEPPANMDPDPFNMFTCGDPVVIPGTPTQPYAFLDHSNVDRFNTPAPGRGGFLFVIRSEAFRPGGLIPGVAVEPAAPSPQLLPPIGSGYDEPAVPNLSGPSDPDPAPDPLNPGETNHAPGGIPDGPPGVHEIAVSVFFIHG